MFLFFVDWAFILTVPFLTAFAAIIASTVTDIKVREVPDWVSYSLVALGLLYALVDTIANGSWTVAYSLLGLAAGYAIGALLYYTGQWGGGDAKLLMGLGATLTLPWQWFTTLSFQPTVLFNVATWRTAPFFLRFLGLMIICGAVYGILWMFYLVIKNWKAFRGHFAKRLHDLKSYRIMVWVVVLILLTIALYCRGLIGLMLFMLAALIYLSFYLMVTIKIAEQQFMLKTIEAKRLTEGDWVVGGVKIGKEWIIPENNIGATKEQIALLTKRSPHTKVVVKEGIPFVPSFLAAFIIAAL